MIQKTVKNYFQSWQNDIIIFT